MKKQYNKPQLFMEEFETAEFIAGNCEYIWRNNTDSVINCYILIPDDLFGEPLRFFNDITGNPCDVNNEDGICYHSPLGEAKLQNS